MRLEAAAVTIRGFLLADVFADLLQLEAHSGHGVPTGPKVLAREIPFLAAQNLAFLLPRQRVEDFS